jgi:hypothetical protein
MIKFLGTILFCKIQEMCDSDKNFMDRLVFSDKATLHLSGKVNRHNNRIWGSEDPVARTYHTSYRPDRRKYAGESVA